MPVNSYREASPAGSVPHEANPVAPDKSLEDPRITRKVGPDPKISPPTLKMVAPRGKCPSRSSTTPTQPCSSDLTDASRKAGLDLEDLPEKRDLVPTRKQVSSNQPGTKGGLSGPKRVPRRLFQQNCTHSNRQHHSC